MSIEFIGFEKDQLPQQKITHCKTQHNIASCRLFFPLERAYWKEAGNKIPQIIITDTYIQDAYALEWTGKDPILLASCTWEDDSLKLLPFLDDGHEKLAKLVLAKLDEITATTVGQRISDYVKTDHPFSYQWIKQPTYIGCSKLYRAHSETNNRKDLAYNQEFGGTSRLYFCGENYGVEGGWTEPALRSALDAVIQLNRDAKFVFTPKQMNDEGAKGIYPKWMVHN